MTGTSSSSWDLLKKIVTASNNQNYDEMYSLIGSNDFSDKHQAVDAAMGAIELVQENVEKHKEDLLHFVGTASEADMSFRTAFRFYLLKDMLGLEPPTQGKINENSK